MKMDHKIPIGKSQDRANEDSGYRPITLESIVAKTITTMLRLRLEWKLGSSEHLSLTQDAYQKEKEGNDLMLRLTQSVQEAWANDKVVILFISDFKGFFESVWRPLLTIKLASAGISGDMLCLVDNYLRDRKIRFQVNRIITEWVESNIGTPQGSNLSTLFTNVYTCDNENDGSVDHGEFSDDNFKWEVADDEETARKQMQIRINNFAKWCRENNIETTILKTKMMVFRSKKAPRPYNKVSLTLNGEAVEEVEPHKALGTTIDNQLNFEKHFERVVKSGYSALNQTKRFSTVQNQHRKKHW